MTSSLRCLLDISNLSSKQSLIFFLHNPAFHSLFTISAKPLYLVSHDKKLGIILDSLLLLHTISNPLTKSVGSSPFEINPKPYHFYFLPFLLLVPWSKPLLFFSGTITVVSQLLFLLLLMPLLSPSSLFST